MCPIILSTGFHTFNVLFTKIIQIQERRGICDDDLSTAVERGEVLTTIVR